MGRSRLEQSRDSMRQEDLRSNEALTSSLIDMIKLCSPISGLWIF